MSQGSLLITNSNGSCSSRGPFPKRLRNVSGSKANFKIKTYWIVSQFLAHKPAKFASLTDSFVVSLSKLVDLEFKHGKHKTAFRVQNVTGTFKKQASGDGCWSWFCLCFVLEPVFTVFSLTTPQPPSTRATNSCTYFTVCDSQHRWGILGWGLVLPEFWLIWGKLPFSFVDFTAKQGLGGWSKHLPSSLVKFFYLLTTIKELEREKLYIFCILWSNVFANWIFVSTGTSSSFLVCFLIHSKVGGALHNPNGITTHSHSSLQSVFFNILWADLYTITFPLIFVKLLIKYR